MSAVALCPSCLGLTMAFYMLPVYLSMPSFVTRLFIRLQMIYPASGARCRSPRPGGPGAGNLRP
jgi:hypothetical protein